MQKGLPGGARAGVRKAGMVEKVTKPPALVDLILPSLLLSQVGQARISICFIVETQQRWSGALPVTGAQLAFLWRRNGRAEEQGQELS